MGNLFAALKSIKEILVVAKSIYVFVVDFFKQKQKDEGKELIKEGIEERDTSKLEEAVGSENAGEPSTDPNPDIKTRDPRV